MVPGSVLPLITEYAELNALNGGVEQEALDEADHDDDRDDDANGCRHDEAANRSTKRMNTRAKPRTRREMNNRSKAVDESKEQDDDQIPCVLLAACP